MSKFLMLLLILAAGVGLCYELAAAASWDFAVFGDTQSPTDPSGVNSTVVTAIATDISTNHNADFVLVAGDLVYFNPTTSGLETQFQNFKAAMTDGGLKLAGTGGSGVDYYPVRGNHESLSESGSIPAWQAQFGNFLPQNGPTTASGGGGNSEVGATYGFTHNNALILSLDEYQNQINAEPTVNQAWVDAQLAANPGKQVFAFGHTPAYEINNSCLAGNQALRNDFLTSLFGAGGVIYFAGHDHLNALARVYDKDPASGGVQQFYQAVIGAGGAPAENFDGDYAADYPVAGLYHDSDTAHSIDPYYGYGIVTVDDNGLWLKLYGTQDVTTSFNLLCTMLMTGAMSVNTSTLSGDINTDATLQFDQTFDGTYAGWISGTGDLVKNEEGALTLTGTNTYSGGTTINAGVLQAATPNALGTGAVTVNHNAALGLGTTSLDLGSGAYTQNTGSSLGLTVNSASSFGNLTTSGIATIASASTVHVTVGGYLPSNTTLAVINGGAGSNISGGTATAVTTSSPFVTFTDALSGNNLVLTATRVANGFQSVASNANAANVGAVFDGITTPSAEMMPVFNALSVLSAGQAASCENSMTPAMDGAMIQSSSAMLNQFVGNVSARLENIRTAGPDTGISTGDDYLKGADIWAQGLGDYARQDPRGLSNGYNAAAWGVTGGADIQLDDQSKHVGIGSGYGQTFVNSKDFSATNDIDSVPITLYYGHNDTTRPFYLDTSATFAYNTYTASRRISVGSAEYTANADYKGQQYSGYIETGYAFPGKMLRFTPLVSFQYAHLHVEKYTESDAGPLNLSVNSQDYDTAQTGLGAKVSYVLNRKDGALTPDLHFKWLYDWVGDSQATTASFAGGGTSFGAQGFSPAQSGYDFGTKITLAAKHNIAIDLDYDFLFKENYYEHTGTVNVKYGF